MAMSPARLCRASVLANNSGHRYNRARRTDERASRVLRVHPAASRVDAPTEAKDVSDRCGPRTAVRCGQHPSAPPSARWLTVVVVPSVPWRSVVSSAVAPVPGSFNAVVSTISSLAACAATVRWRMTLALAGVGGARPSQSNAADGPSSGPATVVIHALPSRRPIVTRGTTSSPGAFRANGSAPRATGTSPAAGRAGPPGSQTSRCRRSTQPPGLRQRSPPAARTGHPPLRRPDKRRTQSVLLAPGDRLRQLEGVKPHAGRIHGLE